MKSSLTTFQALKPWWIRRLNQWNTYCCCYHQELDLLREGLNELRRTGNGSIHSMCHCNCFQVCASHSEIEASDSHVCRAHMRKYERLTNLWTSMLSSKEELSLWHSRSCLLGECPRCRVDFLNLCPSELNTDQVV
jgi:hypothetical protein